MKISQRIKVVFVSTLIGMGALAIAGGGYYGWIQWDAHNKAKTILKSYPQEADEVEAAIQQVFGNQDAVVLAGHADGSVGAIVFLDAQRYLEAVVADAEAGFRQIHGRRCGPRPGQSWAAALRPPCPFPIQGRFPPR